MESDGNDCPASQGGYKGGGGSWFEILLVPLALVGIMILIGIIGPECQSLWHHL